MKKFRDFLFFYIIIFSMFNFIPQKFQIGILGGVIGSKLIMYPMVLLFVCSIYSQYKFKNIIRRFDIFSKYIFVYFIIVFISFIVGIYNYPYYNEILNGTVNISNKLAIFINCLKNFDININENNLAFYYYLLWNFKEIIAFIFWGFGGAYLIYCLYYDDWRKAFTIITRGVLAGIAIVFLYSTIELFYLTGSDWAKKFLIQINPYIHIVSTGYGWWPHLLLKGQLRSVFEEPAHFGIWMSFAIPFLWYKFFVAKTNYKKIFYLIIWIVLSFLCFLTNSRTVTALLLIEEVLIIIFSLYLKEKVLVFKSVVIVGISIIAIFIASSFINFYFVDNNYKISNVEQYLETNLQSIASNSQRSNSARYSVAIANLKIALNYPVLGVGYGLSNAYIRDYLPEISQRSSEVKMWLRLQEEKGILKSGFPKLGEYTTRAAETGFLGLGIYMLAPLYLLNKLRKILCNRYIYYLDKLPYIILTIALIGVLAAGYSNVLNITYCYWVLLGLGYAMCFGKDNEIKTNGDTGSK